MSYEHPSMEQRQVMYRMKWLGKSQAETAPCRGANPKEYRWVRVFPDRIEHRCIRRHEPWAAEWFYRGCTDAKHVTGETYHAGIAVERDLIIQTG